MYKNVICCSVFLISIFAACPARSQTMATAACDFDDGKQMTVRYQSGDTVNRKLEDGKPWSPGNSPMFLFTAAVLKIGNSEIPIGAYSMYIIPGKDRWTLVLNKNVAEHSKYDQHQDLLRAPMDIGTVSEAAKTAAIYFGHVGPKQCNMRVYYGKTGAWTEFHER
jgi:hypothetical protein